jgi:hypothetical protein
MSLNKSPINFNRSPLEFGLDVAGQLGNSYYTSAKKRLRYVFKVFVLSLPISFSLFGIGVGVLKANPEYESRVESRVLNIPAVRSVFNYMNDRLSPESKMENPYLMGPPAPKSEENSESNGLVSRLRDNQLLN